MSWWKTRGLRGVAVTNAGKPIIGLAGGIGSGKSIVASMLAELGAGVIDSDRLSHEEINSPEVVNTLCRCWGSEIVSADGGVNRNAVRRIIQDRSDALAQLERLLHPRIARRSEELLVSYDSDPQIRAIVWDAPLLYEVDLDRRCDTVIFVEADREVRLARIRRRPGWSEEDLEKFEIAQKPLDMKRNKADYVIENNSDLGVLRGQVERVFSRILSGCLKAKG